MTEADGNGSDRPAGLQVQGTLPPFYKDLTVLEASRHADLALAETRNFAFLEQASTIPLTASEIPAAQRDFPVVFSDGEAPRPLAVIAARGAGAFLTEGGAWRAEFHLPAYLARMPFALARIEGDTKRRALCVDAESPLVVNDPDAPAERRLFQDGESTELAQRVIKSCEAFDVAIARTETLCRRFADLGVFERRTVQVTGPNGPREFRGLVVVSEKKLWDLDDATLAGLARSGALSIAAAHLMSIANFRS